MTLCPNRTLLEEDPPHFSASCATLTLPIQATSATVGWNSTPPASAGRALSTKLLNLASMRSNSTGTYTVQEVSLIAAISLLLVVIVLALLMQLGAMQRALRSFVRPRSPLARRCRKSRQEHLDHDELHPTTIAQQRNGNIVVSCKVTYNKGR